MRSLIILMLLVHPMIAKVTNQLDIFMQKCDSAGLLFTMPDGYKEVRIKKNSDLSYDFAIMSKDGAVEIRYSIIPLKSMMRDYKISQENNSTLMISPNILYKTNAQTNLLNMTGGKAYPIGTFPENAVKSEFHADIGLSVFYRFGSTFGEGYRYGQSIYLHRDDVADVIITYLSNNKQKHNEWVFKAFYALTFKER